MADIISPPVIAFCNQYGRPGAEIILDLYDACNEFVVEYEEVVEKDAEWIAASNSDEFADGSPEDGRSRFTKGQLNGMKGVLEAITAAIDAIANWEQIATRIAVKARGERLHF